MTRPWLGLLIITAFTKSMIDWSGIAPISHTPLHIAQSQQERRGRGKEEENEGVARNVSDAAAELHQGKARRRRIGMMKWEWVVESGISGHYEC